MIKIKIFQDKLLLLLLAIPLLTFAQTVKLKIDRPESVQMSSDSIEKMEDHLHKLVDEKKLAGIQTAIFRKDKLVYFDSYGYANIEKAQILNENSIFRIFSMTKPIVSIALMQLYEQGKFKLNDPIHKYIPEFRQMYISIDSILVPAKNSIRIIDLLTHTSGINSGRGPNKHQNRLHAEANLWNSTTNKEFVEKLSKIPLQFEPGTDWTYGLSTNVCGYLIEVLSGKSLDEYLLEFIFKPLEMTDTYFQLPKEKTPNFTVGYGWSEDEKLEVIESIDGSRFIEDVTLFNGGGGLVSTTYDYLNFCKMLLNKGIYNGIRIIKEETINLMLKDHLVEARKYQGRLRLLPREAGFGLGFSIKGDNPKALENVFGWGGAVGTYFRIDTDKDLAYILMIQLSPYRQLRLRELFQNFVNSSIIE